METGKIFLKILEENLAFQRHQETQRMWMANIFIAIIVGTLVYSIKTCTNMEIEQSPCTDIEQIPWFIPLAFLIISTICFLVTMKLNKVFAKTQESIENIFKDGKIPGVKGAQGRRKYMAGTKSEKWIWKILRVRYLYLALYILAIIGSSVWLFILDGPVAWITVPIVGVIVIVVMIFAIIEWCKGK